MSKRQRQDFQAEIFKLKRMEKIVRGPLPLIGILALAFILRVWGLQWGLPNALHINTYHPDELIVVGTSLSMNSLNGQLLPGFYNYPSLQLYLINFACTIAYLFSSVDLAHLSQGYNTANWDKLYLIARSLTVLMATGTVWATAAIGTRLWNKKVGLIAALLLAIAPLHVLQSHWATVDVPATFWGTMAVLAAVWSLEPGRGKQLKGCILSGIFAGLASATKYNMALFILPMIVASLLSVWKGPSFFTSSGTEKDETEAPQKRSWIGTCASVAAGLVCCGLAFLVGCPGFILQHDKFVYDINYEAVHVSQQPGETFEQTGNGFVYEWAHTLNAGLGLPLLLLVTCGIVCAILKRDRSSIIIAAAAIPYCILIGLAPVRYARYSMPLLPLLMLWAALIIVSLVSSSVNSAGQESDPVKRPSALRISGLAALILVFGLTYGYTLWLIVPLTGQDPRDRAVQWLDAHVAQTASVAFPTMPWFQTAPVCIYLPSQRGEWQRNPDMQAQCTRILYTTDWDPNLLTLPNTGAVVVSEYDTMDALRLNNKAAEAYLDALDNQYSKKFEAGGYDPPFGLFMRHLPHDMIYANPQITVYVRR